MVPNKVCGNKLLINCLLHRSNNLKVVLQCSIIALALTKVTKNFKFFISGLNIIKQLDRLF